IGYKAEGLKELLAQHLARMDRSHLVHGIVLSVIVHDLHLLRPGVGPDEAQPPLVVDADAVLPGAIALQRFEPICRRCAQIPQLRGVIEHLELASSHTLDIAEPRDASACKQRFCVRASERAFPRTPSGCSARATRRPCSPCSRETPSPSRSPSRRP